MLDNHCSRSQATPTAACFSEIHSNFESVQSRTAPLQFLLPRPAPCPPPNPRFPVWQKRRQTCLNVCLCLQGEGRPRSASSVDYASVSFAFLETDGIQFPPSSQAHFKPQTTRTTSDGTALTPNNGPPSLPDFLHTNHAMHPSRRGGRHVHVRGHPYRTSTILSGFWTPSPLLSALGADP